MSIYAHNIPKDDPIYSSFQPLYLSIQSKRPKKQYSSEWSKVYHGIKLGQTKGFTHYITLKTDDHFDIFIFHKFFLKSNNQTKHSPIFTDYL